MPHQRAPCSSSISRFPTAMPTSDIAVLSRHLAMCHEVFFACSIYLPETRDQRPDADALRRMSSVVQAIMSLLSLVGLFSLPGDASLPSGSDDDAKHRGATLAWGLWLVEGTHDAAPFFRSYRLVSLQQTPVHIDARVISKDRCNRSPTGAGVAAGESSTLRSIVPQSEGRRACAAA